MSKVFRITIAIQVPCQVNECNICASCCTSHLRRVAKWFIVCKQCVYVTLSALSSVPVFLLSTVMNPPFQPNSWPFSESSAWQKVSQWQKNPLLLLSLYLSLVFYFLFYILMKLVHWYVSHLLFCTFETFILYLYFFFILYYLTKFRIPLLHLH